MEIKVDNAEIKAMQEYPEKLEWDCWDMQSDSNLGERIAYTKGYRQAEEDIKRLLIDWLTEHRKSKKGIGLISWGMRTAIGQIIDKVKSL
jgi:hypothetical protein